MRKDGDGYRGQAQPQAHGLQACYRSSDTDLGMADKGSEELGQERYEAPLVADEDTIKRDTCGLEIDQYEKPMEGTDIQYSRYERLFLSSRGSEVFSDAHFLVRGMDLADVEGVITVSGKLLGAWQHA
ncbi:hypothetical protein BDV96DRAFT_601538 [Lophiotrema nucula]|uniref:Uncharacterized protein n=1 Tax=Lophiotrema nucula TaxID=690887 RepID=A0A6A5Z1R3_9PLEO|nr:hypothetical protein BDV96DRAFT_601538 [Lophiotrema nucula]